MSIDKNLPIDGANRPEGPQNVQPVQPGSGATEFRRLLEKLESVAKREADKSTDVSGVDELRDAMAKADEDYLAVMDLRKKLEDAYRGSKP